MTNLDKLLYDVNVTCPVCNHAFKAQRVRRSALIPDGRDSDFYVRYRGFDPTDYSVWQCPACGFANAEGTFDEMNPAERHVLQAELQKIQPLPVPRERDVATVMALFERAVFSAQARNSHSRAAGLYLRMAWVQRREGNAAEERAYLEKAFDSYLIAYQQEPFPIGKMSELTVLYLLGELARRLGRYNEAVEYFAGVTQSRDQSEPQIISLAKEQWELARQQAAEAAEAAEAGGDEAGESDSAESGAEPTAAAEVAATTAAPAAATPTTATASATAKAGGQAAAGTTKQDSAAVAAQAASAAAAAQAAAVAQSVLVGFSIQPDQLEWLQVVARHSGDRLDRSTVLQAVLTAVQQLAPERVARATAAEVAEAVRQELAKGQ